MDSYGFLWIPMDEPVGTSVGTTLLIVVVLGTMDSYGFLWMSRWELVLALPFL